MLILVEFFVQKTIAVCFDDRILRYNIILISLLEKLNIKTENWRAESKKTFGKIVKI